MKGGYEEKYIDLLIEKCTELDKNKSLFIHYSEEIKPFIEKLVEKVEVLGVKDIYLDHYDPYEIHDFLIENSNFDIENSSYFDDHIWDEYARKNACFLIFETEYPHLMDDVEPRKIAISAKRKRETKSLYRYMVEHCQLSWCIAAYPGKCWAEDIFKGFDCYQKLEQSIYKICMLDQDNPVISWEEFLNKTRKIMNYLNQLGLTSLHYTNSLGTNLKIYLPEHYLFSNAEDGKVIVNMPSYEVFTSPDFRKTEGIVYSAKPLIYNGAFIDDFWLKFKEGKVIDYDAKVGKEILTEILSSDPKSSYLGECALVEKYSPIASMGIIFGTTLIDENASCHLALGAGFPECIENGLELNDDQLLLEGINLSKTHVDFMIGTNDLSIVGITKDGEKIPIFVDGNFSDEILIASGVK